MKFQFQEVFPQSKVETEYRKLDIPGVSTEKFKGKEILVIEPSVLTKLTKEALKDVSHLLRPSHLQQLKNILDEKAADIYDLSESVKGDMYKTINGLEQLLSQSQKLLNAINVNED